jgi:hypothetical protein
LNSERTSSSTIARVVPAFPSEDLSRPFPFLFLGEAVEPYANLFRLLKESLSPVALRAEGLQVAPFMRAPLVQRAHMVYLDSGGYPSTDSALDAQRGVPQDSPPNALPDSPP